MQLEHESRAVATAPALGSKFRNGNGTENNPTAPVFQDSDRLGLWREFYRLCIAPPNSLLSRLKLSTAIIDERGPFRIGTIAEPKNPECFEWGDDLLVGVVPAWGWHNPGLGNWWSDLIGFDLRHPQRAWSRLGIARALNESMTDTLGAADRLPVYRDVLSWLRAENGPGIFILHGASAAERRMLLTAPREIVVEDDPHAQQLERMMREPIFRLPKILVPEHRRAA